MSFRNNLKQARENAGLTQTELAEKLGVTQAIISFWEIGRNFPGASKLPELSSILGCTINDLFNVSENESEVIVAENENG